MTELEIKCKCCKKKFTRQVKTYQPEDFSSKGTKSIMSQYWCPHCKEAGAARYSFYYDKEGNICAKIKRYINVNDLFIKKPSQTSMTVKPSFDN